MRHLSWSSRTFSTEVGVFASGLMAGTITLWQDIFCLTWSELLPIIQSKRYDYQLSATRLGCVKISISRFIDDVKATLCFGWEIWKGKINCMIRIFINEETNCQRKIGSLEHYLKIESNLESYRFTVVYMLIAKDRIILRIFKWLFLPELHCVVCHTQCWMWIACLSLLFGFFNFLCFQPF